MNNSNILLLCPCKRELLTIQSLNKESSSISLSYLCKSHTKEISIENYYTQLLSKRKEELCSFSKHKDKLIGSIYYCKCNCWLCDECLAAHNALQIGHFFTYTVLDCFDYCTNHNINVASFTVKHVRIVIVINVVRNIKNIANCHICNIKIKY